MSLFKRAQERGLLDIRCIDIRDFALDKHRKVDERPFGGGPGMVLMPGPVAAAIEYAKTANCRVIYLSPQGAPLNAKRCRELAKEEHLILLCGHYEGIDERVLRTHVDEEISIGDYVLTSGCSAAVVLIDAVMRFVPGVIDNEESIVDDSFEDRFFDAPLYAGPDDFRGLSVPEVLKSGHHAKIKKWRKQQAYEKTCRVRPDLIDAPGNLG